MRPRSRTNRARLAFVALARVVAGGALAGLLAVACGESRRPIGEECLRDDDCLSGFCAARSCVSAPTLATGTHPPPEDEEPRIPVGDALPAIDAGEDAALDGS